SNSAVRVYCTDQSNGLPSFTVALSTGNAGVFNPRKMLNGGKTLKYNMYIDTGYLLIWGDGTSGTVTQSYNVTLGQSQVSFTDYGQVPSSQIVISGTYTDSITVTVTF